VHVEPSHWLHEISILQNYSSPFLAYANTPIVNWGYLFIYLFFSYYYFDPPLFLMMTFPFNSHTWLLECHQMVIEVFWSTISRLDI
jgi:hypothetical protein